MKRMVTIWAVFGGLVWILSYETFQFKTLQQFKLPELQFSVGSLSSISSAVPASMNYTSFLALQTNRTNYTALANNSTESPLLKYFPDFCGDCIWGGNGGLTCDARVHHLRSKYGTQNTLEVVMKERVVCKNPPLQIFWQDDGNDELDSMFIQPRPLRGNITTSPMLGNISIYFYETLRKDVGEDLVNNLREQYAQRNNTASNGQADIAIIDLFRSFPGRTDDPNEADIFIVPYPHASHCISKPGGIWLNACGHIGQNLVQDGVFKTLNHYAGNENRHLFLNVINQGNSNPVMRNTPLSLSIGPRYKGTNLLVPYLNNLASFQPSAIRNRDVSWWTRPRTYSLTYFFGISNSKMRNSPRVWRMYFLENVQQTWPDNLGGLPYAIRVMPSGKKPPSRFFSHMYKDSIFCPTLPGDTPPQKRFFDVIMMGCIPVVFSWDFDSNGENRTSWHQPGGQFIEDSYPWIKGSNSVHPRNEIDYKSFVVEVKGGVENFRPTIEGLMQNYTDIRRRQLNLMKYAPYFSYGMGSDSHKHPDSFSKILESLRFYLDGL